MTTPERSMQDEGNKPMNWDMWTCFNKKRWEQRAKERAAAPRKQEDEPQNCPKDWDMWKSDRKH